MAGERVLLVDDEEDFVEVLKMRLEMRDIYADTASNGMEAIERESKRSYDAVVLDMTMPGMDGFEVLRRMLDRNPDLHIILLTGHATIEMGITAMKRGAFDFLEKPADLSRLTEMIAEAATQKMVALQKRMEEKIQGIVAKKSW